SDGPEAVIHRIHRLEKRDMLLVLKANTAVADSRGEPFIMNPEVLERRSSTIAGHHAPLDVRTLAYQADEAGMYAMHRWASTVVHPGFGNLQVYRRFEGTEVLKAIHGPFAVMTIYGRMVLKRLAPLVQPPSLDFTANVIRGGGLFDGE